MNKQPKLKVGGVHAVKDGVTHRYYLNKKGEANEITICCDCGLVHIEEFKPTKRYIRVRVWRDDKLTKRFRRKGKWQARQKKQ